MPIIIGGRITAGKSSVPLTELSDQELAPTQPIEQNNINIVVEPTTEEQKTLKRKFVIEKNKLKGVASSDTSLIINGKKKHIGRKSQYLLDMLTLDSE